MSAHRPSKLALLAACACVLAGCSHTAKVGPDRMLRIGLNEYRLNPEDVQARSGLVTFYVRNFGRLKHDLLVTQNGQTAVFVPPLSPGQSIHVMVYLTPGKYSMSSTVLSDNALGAYGSLTVGK